MSGQPSLPTIFGPPEWWTEPQQRPSEKLNVTGWYLTGSLDRWVVETVAQMSSRPDGYSGFPELAYLTKS